jgi:anti-sigma regulatory factor (Ser/Thr protein kinase)/ligand-binding sensor protein
MAASPAFKTRAAELHISLPPQPAALFGVRARIRTHLQLSPLDPGQIDEVVLAVEEACTNAIRHSRSDRDIDISLGFEAADLVAMVRDRGRAFDLSRFDPGVVPDLFATGGRGLFLISRLMDEVDLRVHGGLEVRMRKRGSGDPDAPRYRLADLIDVPRLQELLDSLHAAFDCPTAVVDNEAKILTATAWQDVCTQFHRVHPETLGECQQSDLHIYGRLRHGAETVAYACPRGMIDCASPIVIEGRHLGNVFIGQVFVEPPDLESFRAQARRFGFDEEAYLEAVQRVPVISREELERRLPFVRALAEMIAELGLSRLKERLSLGAATAQRWGAAAS